MILNDNVSHISISHTEITNSDNTANDVNFGSLVYAYRNVTYITFSFSKLHHVFGCVIQTGYPGADNWTVEYSKMGDNTGTSAHHSEIWSLFGNDNLTIRYSWLFKWRSTGAIVAINGRDGQYGDLEICENWNIYGNVFNQEGTTSSWVLAAIDDIGNQQVARNWRVVNNTFVDLNSTATWVLLKLSTYGVANNTLINNIFWSTDSVELSGWDNEDYNSYMHGLDGEYFKGAHDSALIINPFVNYTGDNYRLSEELAGLSLTGEYTKDANGVVRGNDGVWDRGAFEFDNLSNTRPSAPSNLRVVPQ